MEPLQPEDAIRMHQPGNKDWSLGRCVQAAGEHHYDVEVEGHKYCQNQRDLQTMPEIIYTWKPDMSGNAKEATRLDGGLPNG